MTSYPRHWLNDLCSAAYTIKFRGFGALDAYFGLPALPFLFVETSADIAVLARFVENLRFPGVEIADAAADSGDGTCYFHCLEGAAIDDIDEQDNHSFPILSFACNLQNGHFEDHLGVYPLLRELRKNREHFLEAGCKLSPALISSLKQAVLTENFRWVMDAALLLARYGFVPEPGTETSVASTMRGFPLELQRAFLCCLLVSPRPDLGLELLKRASFIEKFWPELAALDDVDHSKEYHPEGNVWSHTLETFRHRKPAASGAFDLRLSLGLLLHDAGKPIAAANGSRRFDGHAELGARAAARFLERLGFESAITQDIFYLVKNHMLPAALKRLPLSRTGEIMASPLFPSLMELYRCDESSSFKGLDGYYENSAAYQAYLRNIRNPYRSPDGKKKGKREMYLR